MYYEPVKTTIDIVGLAEVMINIVVRHHGLPELIISDQDSLFPLKFLSYFIIFLVLSRNFQLHFIRKLMARVKGKTAQ